jgi:hypothetical protein
MVLIFVKFEFGSDYKLVFRATLRTRIAPLFKPALKILISSLKIIFQRLVEVLNLMLHFILKTYLNF